MMFDVVHVADMRFPGGTSAAIAHEVRALNSAGYKIGLIQKDAPVLANKPHLGRHPKLAQAIADGTVTLLEAGVVESRLVLLHNPHIVEDMAGSYPEIRTQKSILVVHQPLATTTGRPHYDAAAVDANAALLTGKRTSWAPISPISRDNCLRFGAGLEILPHNWQNIVFVEDWRRPAAQVRGALPVVGRHSRPDQSKWPISLDCLKQTCPDDPSYDVRLLGAGHGLEKLLDGQAPPANWQTWAFNEIPVIPFVQALDFFVYYHKPEIIEGFGRTIAEAMAAGCVVILPPYFERTFAEGALYREPAAVRATIDALWANPTSFATQAAKGPAWIDQHYGPKPYLALVRQQLGFWLGNSLPP
jgi:glycosyltransferase involved in cell wall biosynthesis